MSDKIKFNEIVDKDVVKGLEAVAEGLKLLDDELKKVAESSKKVLDSTKKTDFKSLKELEKTFKTVNSAQKESVIIAKERQKLDQEIERTTQQKIKTEQQSLRLKTQQTRESERLAKQQLKEKKAADQLTSAYARESKRLNELRKRFKDLILVEGQSSKAAQKLQKEISTLDSRLKKVDASAGQFQRNVGNYPRAFKGAIGALKNFAGALGITAGITGLVRALGNSINIAKEFEQSNANLASVLGTTKDQIGALTEDAKRLGAATAFSASEVSGLQTEFAKLGFNEQEILNATEATLSLAAATGSDLAESAAIAGATLGGFGLGAEETQRVVDVMAKSFSTSALDLEKFKESMKDAAPAAKAVGVSVEETTALLGTLANAGISGSKAGNALKAGFIELNAAGLDLDKGLEQIANSNDKLATATELVGKRAATSFLVLADGTEEIDKLTKGLEQAGGAAERMAKEQLNTLEGSLKILNSAWEGFVLGLLSGDGAFSQVSRSIVQATTSLLGFLTAVEDANEITFESAIANRELADSSQELLNEYESLVRDGVKPTKEEKIELDRITLQLKDRLGESVIEIDKETGAFELNTDAVKEQIKVKRFASDQEAATLASRLKGVQEELKIQEAQLLANKEERKRRSEIQREARQRRAELEDEERFNRKASDALIKARKDESFAQEQFIKFAKEAQELNIPLLENREKEADLIEKLNKLNFTAADVEALFADNKSKSNKSTGESVDSVTDLIKIQEELLKQARELSGATESDVEFRNKRIATIDAEIKRLRALGDVERDNTKFKRLTFREQRKEQAKRDKEEAEALEKALETDLVIDKNRIAAAKRTSDEEERLRLEAVANAKRERDERRKLIKDTTSEILNAFAERSKAREAEIDEEISATQKRQDQLRRLSESGVQNAEQSLADANVREAQLRKQKEEQIQRQKQIEASLAALEVFASEIQAGKSPTQALASTVTNVSLLRKVISSLPSFESGTDDTGSGRGRGVDGKGGFTAILHDNESVWTKEDNKKKGNRTNAQAANILEAYDKGTLQGISIPNATNDDNLALLAGISAMNNSLNRVEKTLGITEKVRRDEFLNTMKLIVQKGNTTTTTKIDKYNL